MIVLSRIWPGIIIVVGLAAGIAYVYADATSYGFLHGDDHRHIRDNPYVQALNPTNLLWMFASAEIDYWRPLSFLTHALDYAFWGQNIGGHHVSSIVLHALNAALVSGIAFSVFSIRHTSIDNLGGSREAWICAGLAGALFALHPQHVETTAWLAERKGVLVATFFLAALWCYLRGRGQVRRWRVFTLLFGVLAMLSKPSAVSLPLVLLMLDIYPLQRLQMRSHWTVWLKVLLEKVPYLILALAVSLYTYFAVETGGFLNSTEVLSLAERLINAARSVWLYIGRWIAPFGLVPIYPITEIDNSVNFKNLLAPAALIITVVVAVCLWWRRQSLMIGVVGIHLALLGPVVGLVSVGAQSSADRYAYLPGVWISILVASTIVFMIRRLRTMPTARWTVIACVAAWLAGLGSLTIQQVRLWESDVAMQRVFKLYYPNWLPDREYAAGLTAYKRGHYQNAAKLFEIAIARRQFVPRAHMFLALTLQKLRQPGLALEHLNEALRKRPNSLFLLQLASQLHARAGRIDEARQLTERAAALAPGDPESVRQRAIIEIQAARYEVATRALENLVQSGDVNAHTHVLLGISAHRQGDAERARRHYQDALRIDPGNEDALHNVQQLEPVVHP